MPFYGQKSDRSEVCAAEPGRSGWWETAGSCPMLVAAGCSQFWHHHLPTEATALMLQLTGIYLMEIHGHEGRKRMDGDRLGDVAGGMLLRGLLKWQLETLGRRPSMSEGCSARTGKRVRDCGCKGTHTRAGTLLRQLQPVGGPCWSRGKPPKKEGGTARNQCAQRCTAEPLCTGSQPVGLPLAWLGELKCGCGEVLDLMLFFPLPHSPVTCRFLCLHFIFLSA